MKLTLLYDEMACPSSWDNFSGERPDKSLYCVLAHTRDSDALEESNFLAALDRLGGEGENVEIHRVGHWACGWIEYLAVRERTDKFAIGDRIIAELNDYPVLDEDRYYDLQDEYGELDVEED